MGRSLAYVATMRTTNLHYNLTISNNGNNPTAGNVVSGWKWVGKENQVWDVQLHPTNGAYNDKGDNKWTYRSMSGGGATRLYLTSLNKKLTIEEYTSADSAMWVFNVVSGAFRSKSDGKVDFGSGYKAGTQAKCDGFHSKAWNTKEKFEIKWVHNKGGNDWVDTPIKK